MPSKTRLTKGKIVSAPEGTLPPAPFPLATWVGGRRRIPSQARSLRTRGVILESARELANSKGVGAPALLILGQTLETNLAEQAIGLVHKRSTMRMVEIVTLVGSWLIGRAHV